MDPMVNAIQGELLTQRVYEVMRERDAEKARYQRLVSAVRRALETGWMHDETRQALEKALAETEKAGAEPDFPIETSLR